MVQRLHYYRLYHESHRESAALAYTIRVDTNLAIHTIDYLLHNVEAEADTLLINLVSPLQLSKARE